MVGTPKTREVPAPKNKTILIGILHTDTALSEISEKLFAPAFVLQAGVVLSKQLLAKSNSVGP